VLSLYNYPSVSLITLWTWREQFYIKNESDSYKTKQRISKNNITRNLRGNTYVYQYLSGGWRLATPLENTESPPIWGISCIINEVLIFLECTGKVGPYVWPILLMHCKKITGEGGWNKAIWLVCFGHYDICETRILCRECPKPVTIQCSHAGVRDYCILCKFNKLSVSGRQITNCQKFFEIIKPGRRFKINGHRQ